MRKTNMTVEEWYSKMGRKGGKARMALLSDEERSEFGRAAIAKRWKGHTKPAKRKR